MIEEMLTGKSNYITVSDGVKLHYIEAGSGQPLVMIPGWSQTAEQFKYQIDNLSSKYRIIALDMRGHGESDKPSHGYRVSRFAMDVHEILTTLNLDNIVLLGHSMGCAVIWSYWDLFGSDKLLKLVLVDQSPFITSNFNWSDNESKSCGSFFNLNSLMNTYNALNGPDSEEFTKKMINGMLTSTLSEKKRKWIIKQNFKFPRKYAASLLYSNCTRDWRDTIPRINIPTQIISGRVSIVPWQSQVWIHDQIAGSKLDIFEEKEGGQHFMFIENPNKFNRIITEFIG
ncbi:MAG TPA: alpha/beta hydrolase [Victivallales bacterium]|nr:alpha/beta hydrolase [Victivallales bacterium]